MYKLYIYSDINLCTYFVYFKIPVIKPISYYGDILLFQHKFYLNVLTITFKWEGRKIVCHIVPSELFHVTFSGENRYFPCYPQGGRLIPFLLEGTFWVIIKDHFKLLFLIFCVCDYFFQRNELLFMQDIFFFKLTTYRWPVVWKHISKSFTHTHTAHSQSLKSLTNATSRM